MDASALAAATAAVMASDESAAKRLRLSSPTDPLGLGLDPTVITAAAQMPFADATGVPAAVGTQDTQYLNALKTAYLVAVDGDVHDSVCDMLHQQLMEHRRARRGEASAPSLQQTLGLLGQSQAPAAPQINQMASGLLPQAKPQQDLGLFNQLLGPPPPSTPQVDPLEVANIIVNIEMQPASPMEEQAVEAGGVNPRRLFIGSFRREFNDQQILTTLFSPFGKITEVKMLHGKGVAYIQYADFVSAKNAVAYLDGKNINGMSAKGGLNVKYSRR